MLSIRTSKQHNVKSVPNLLPCRVNHHGLVNASKKYWSPSRAKDGKMVSYFRGRKFYGKELKIPNGYSGAILVNTGKMLPLRDASNAASNNDEDAENINVGILEERACFDELVIWGHEVLPEGMSDPFVKGTEEWIDFAAQLHSYETHTAGK